MADVQHSTLTDPQLHEPKGASTAASGEVYVADGAGSGVWTPQTDLQSFTGWVQYSDSTYTSGSPLAVTAGTRTKLTIDGLAEAVTSQLPPDSGGNTIWDTTTNKITPINAFDAYDVRLVFKSLPTGTSPYVTIELDIGAPVNTIVQQTFFYAKGAAVTNVLFTFPVYTGATFLANGGEFYVTPSNNTDFYEAQIFILRKHRGV